jgi:tetratricopeptide (TPR) repeat protein
LSLKDCAEVLKRNPRHFGVLSGYGQIYLRKGDLERALDYFRRALSINPNMEGVRSSIGLIEKVLVERRRKFI